MAIEAGVAIVAALVAGSVALLGFGLDSLIEMGSAATILWLWSGTRAGNQGAERLAQQIIAASFLALAAYLTYDAIKTLAAATHPEVSWPGVAISVGAIVVMPLLARAKNQVAAELGSAATAGDAAQSWLCAIAAGAVLVSIIVNAAFGWWWLDPVMGLGIAGLAIHEGREAWAGEICADCAPLATRPRRAATASVALDERRRDHSHGAVMPGTLMGSRRMPTPASSRSPLR